jgi:hypothetical protein
MLHFFLFSFCSMAKCETSLFDFFPLTACASTAARSSSIHYSHICVRTKRMMVEREHTINTRALFAKEFLLLLRERERDVYIAEKSDVRFMHTDGVNKRAYMN